MIDHQAIEPIVDVRPLAKPDKHPTIFATYRELPVGGSLVLVNDHDPKHLRDEFEVDHPGSHRWEYLSEQPRDWRIRITKLTSTPLPRVLVDTGAAVRSAARMPRGRSGSSRCAIGTWIPTSSRCPRAARSTRTPVPTSMCSCTCSAAPDVWSPRPARSDSKPGR